MTAEVAVARPTMCSGCGRFVADDGVVCGDCAADPFAMEDARGRAAANGSFDRLSRLYDRNYAYLREGHVSRLWEDTLLGDKDPIPEFSAWRNLQSVGLVPKTARRIMEIGPGVGHSIPLLRERCPSADYYAADLSEKTVERLAERHRGTFAVAAIEDLPWKHVTFDAILMLEVLEHVEAPRTFRVLSALRERLSENGVLILSVPLREDLRRSYFVCAHCGQQMHQIGHVRSYTPELLHAELRLSGFTIDRQLPLAGGTYFGIRRQHLIPFFPQKIQPMVLVARCGVSGSATADSPGP